MWIRDLLNRGGMLEIFVWECVRGFKEYYRKVVLILLINVDIKEC